MCFSDYGWNLNLLLCEVWFFSPQSEALSVLPFTQFFTRKHNGTVIKFTFCKCHLWNFYCDHLWAIGQLNHLHFLNHHCISKDFLCLKGHMRPSQAHLSIIWTWRDEIVSEWILKTQQCVSKSVHPHLVQLCHT